MQPSTCCHFLSFHGVQNNELVKYHTVMVNTKITFILLFFFLIKNKLEQMVVYLYFLITVLLLFSNYTLIIQSFVMCTLKGVKIVPCDETTVANICSSAKDFTAGFVTLFPLHNGYQVTLVVLSSDSTDYKYKSSLHALLTSGLRISLNSRQRQLRVFR